MLAISMMNGSLYGPADCGPDQRWDPNMQVPGLPPGQCMPRCGPDQRWDPNAAVPGLAPGQCMPLNSTPAVPLQNCSTTTPASAMCVGANGLVSVGPVKVPLYKNWKFWAVLGGAVAAGGASYAIVRSRRAHAHY
jgi:hypothetical protein